MKGQAKAGQGKARQARQGKAKAEQRVFGWMADRKRKEGINIDRLLVGQSLSSGLLNLILLISLKRPRKKDLMEGAAPKGRRVQHQKVLAEKD